MLNNSVSNDVYNDLEDSIEVYKNKLDVISNDIRSIEKKLYFVGDIFEVITIYNVLKEGLEGHLTFENKRIMAEYKDMKRPLIEMPVKYRLAFYKHITEFIKCLTKKLNELG